MNIRATDSVSVYSPRGTSLSILKNLSKTIRIMYLPKTIGNSIKKSIAMLVQGTAAIAIG